MLQIHVVLCILKSLETVFLIAICRQSGDKWQSKKPGDKWQSKTLFRMIFDLRSSIVLTFSIAGYPVWNFQKYLKEIQLIFIASYTATCDFQQCGILTWIVSDQPV